jgi:hypothetical protein
VTLKGSTVRVGALKLLLIPVCCSSPAIAFAADPSQLSLELRSHGDYAQAESVLREGLKNEAAGTTSRANLMMDLADLLREEDRTAEARPYFQGVLDLPGIAWESRFGALMGIADIDRVDQSWDASISKWNEASALATSHNDAVMQSLALRGLGETWMDRGNLARAEPLLKRALAGVENQPGVEVYRVAVALDSLASLYRTEAKFSMAEELWNRELQIDRKFFGDYHPQTALVMGHLAEAWSADGDFDRARDYSGQATAIMTSHFAFDSAPVAAALVNQAAIEQRAHNLQRAAELYGKAFGIFQSTKETPSHAGQIVARLYAGVLSQLHRGQEAKQIAAEASAFRAK